MYKCAKALMYLGVILAIPALLSACGGTSEKDALSQADSTAITREADSKSSSVVTLSSQAAASSAQPTSTDLEKPSTTIQLQLYKLSETSITLVWDDVTGVSHYKIARNGELIAQENYPSHTLVDKGLAPNTEYTYTISAFDLTGNQAGTPQTFTMRTLAASGATSSKSSLSTQPDSSMPSIGAPPSISSSLPSSLPEISSASSSGHSPSSMSAKSSSSSNTSAQSSSSSSKVSAQSSSSATSSSAESSSSRFSSASSASSASSVVAQTVTLSWNHPDQRVNGDFLELEEIGGYEIRYRKLTDTHYTYLTLNGSHATEYTFPKEMQIRAQDMEFEIAAFDTAGIYSQFVKVGQ